MYSTTMYCTVLQYNALYCTLLYMYHGVLYCTAMYCTVLYRTLLYCNVLYCTLMYCTTMHYNAMQCTVLYCTVLYYNVLYCNAMHFDVMYCTYLDNKRKITGKNTMKLVWNNEIIWWRYAKNARNILFQLCRFCIIVYGILEPKMITITVRNTNVYKICKHCKFKRLALPTSRHQML